MATCYSASAIVGGTVTEQYVYKRTKELPNTKRIQSPPFWVGKYSWRISYYPNGSHPSYADYISVFLNLGGTITKPVKVRPRFSLLDKAGNPVPAVRSQYTESIEFFVVGAGKGFHDFIKREGLEASEHLVDDCLRIRCDVILPASIRTEDRAPPPSDLQRPLGNLFVNKEGADITFQVGGETFSAHRCVLASRSPVFRAELFGATREGTTTTTIRDYIRIDDLLAEMTGLEESMMAEHLLEAAGRYDMQGLKLICEEKLSRDVNGNTVAKMLRLAVQHRCHTLRETCVEFLNILLHWM
ncbi:hypothetical protein SETIT_9G211100v2 [Setaria italica]|uniref:BTB domain-containing protein n=1 Tax=Setaria italica TaxID=4555 RepID=A0A368SIU8_SETIT|nr:hypothetical protein SETIT_9G211100v2 [Setaria italica]